MFKPLAIYIGLRYTRAKRRNQFISFISVVSLLGMILGVFALVVVLSVMNGFEAELRSRILSVVPHGYIDGPDSRLESWPDWASKVSELPEVTASAPYISGTVMISRNNQVKAARLTAVDPIHEINVSQIGNKIVAGNFSALQEKSYGVVLGSNLSKTIGVYIGDTIDIVLPRVSVTPFGVFPRMKRFTVVGVFNTGSQLDSDGLFIHLSDGQKLFQLGNNVNGLRLQLTDLFLAPAAIPKIAQIFPEGSSAKPWSETQGSLFSAVNMEKTMVSLLLFVIVAIAAFNIISILTMMVADKRSDIAVLRTMGAEPGTIMNIFMIQGMSVGFVGILIGVFLGVPAVIYLSDIVSWFESMMGSQVFNPDVYYITRIPTVLKVSDIVNVIGFGVLLSILATLYPAYRASKIEPAEVLRYE